MAAYQPPAVDYFTADQVASLLGVHSVTVRRWRTLNKAAGELRHGPPYEFRGSRVVYPKDAFRDWCSSVRVVDGVPRLNLPLTSAIPPPVAATLQQQTVTAEAPPDIINELENLG